MCGFAFPEVKPSRLEIQKPEKAREEIEADESSPLLIKPEMHSKTGPGIFLPFKASKSTNTVERSLLSLTWIVLGRSSVARCLLVEAAS
jgi:hypothetical protein